MAEEAPISARPVARTAAIDIPEDAHPVVRDLGKFARFIVAVYGILVALLAAVPVASSFAGGLELTSLWHFSSCAVILLASILVLFTFFYMFSERDRYRSSEYRKDVRRSARRSIIGGSVCLVGFLLASAAFDEATYGYWLETVEGRTAPSDRLWTLSVDEFAYFGDTIISILYVVTLVLVTRAFTFLALFEYFYPERTLTPADV